jgi:hypothetical protein
MKIYLSLFFFCAYLTSGQTAALGFTNQYSAANWTQAIDGGSIDLTQAPTSISINSSDDASGEINKFQDFTISATNTGLVSFNWSYLTQDTDGAGNDDFGWLLNGVFTKISNGDGAASQSGVFSASVAVGDVFGFRAYSLDSLGGAATTTISQFAAPVPLPTAAWLFGSGLFGFLWQAKRKNQIF